MYAGDVAVICVEFTILKLATTPPNLTVVTLVKLAPLIVTVVPPACGPLVGLMVYMMGLSGGGLATNLLAKSKSPGAPAWPVRQHHQYINCRIVVGVWITLRI